MKISVTQNVLRILITSILVCGYAHASYSKNPNEDSTLGNEFRLLDEKTQKIKLRMLDLNRVINKYASEPKSKIEKLFKGKYRAEFSLDFVFKDHANKQYFSAINRYHAGRDFGGINSRYETALRVANIYLDYGLYNYSKQIFSSLLGDEDTAVASLARFYLAKHNYRKNYWDAALTGFESVVDGIPEDLLDEKRILQSIILQNRKKHDLAIEILTEVSPTSKYYAHAQFNIAMSYLRKGWWTDAEETIYKLIQLNSVKASKSGKAYKLNQSMIDRFYIALGYSQLQREYYREAYSSLTKVDKKGLYGYKAKLGMGIVAAEQEKYEEALTGLEHLIKTYSKQLPTQEARIVIPFVLESIGSTERSLDYYSSSAEYFQEMIQEIANYKKAVQQGQLDDFIIKSRQQKTDTPLVPGAHNPKSDYRKLLLFELSENAYWQTVSTNYQDLVELEQYIHHLQDKLKQAGNYHNKEYKKLAKKIANHHEKINKLKTDSRDFIRKLIDRHLTDKKEYLTSYLNQSKYAKARIHDMALGTQIEVTISRKNITAQDVRNFYRDYLKSASTSSHNRRTAILRLAELEMSRRDQIIADNRNRNSQAMDSANQLLNSSIALMQEALRDYPEHKANDVLLYRLVSAYDRQQQKEKAVETMRQLVDNYPQSRFYTEIQFKLGEGYLTSDDAIDAELAYSAAIQSGDTNSIFYRRSVYKRGWSRLRQRLYQDALDDFFEVLNLSDYSNQVNLSKAEQALYEDILRAISLCFSSIGNLAAIEDYFKHSNFKSYIHLAYENLGELYESQERMHDAVNIYNAYLKKYHLEPYAPQFALRIIAAWEKAKKPQQVLIARTNFETKYTLNSPFWKKNDHNQFKHIREALEQNVIFMARHYHALFQKNQNRNNLAQAKYWYKKFDKYADASKNANEIFFGYAELLSEAGETDQALAYYEKADRSDRLGGGSAKNKETLYAKIVTADKISLKGGSVKQKKEWLLKKVAFAVEFVQTFPGDKRSPATLLHAIESLYKNGQYQQVIDTIDQIPTSLISKLSNDIDLYAAHSLFALQEYKQAEERYTKLGIKLRKDKQNKNERARLAVIEERLASAIYKQGEMESGNKNTQQAIQHYLRVAKKLPQSSVAPVADFEAARLLIESKDFAKSEKILARFEKKYPDHSLISKVNNKLAYIYTQLTDKPRMASAYEKIFQDTNNDSQTRRNFLIQAAQIYAETGKHDKAISLYEKFVHEYKQYHETTMEALYELAGLYAKISMPEKTTQTYKKMVDYESKTRHDAKTDRTRYLRTQATLALIDAEMTAYKKIVIKEPLEQSLKKKKKALKRLVEELTEISNYGLEETTTQAIYYIGEAYNEFGLALLSSPRPRHLKDIELDQYELLLEEQAFPFEEKAIGFYKENLNNIKAGVYNQWIKYSLERLSTISPGRYRKQEKLDSFIDIPLVGIDAASN